VSLAALTELEVVKKWRRKVGAEASLASEEGGENRVQRQAS